MDPLKCPHKGEEIPIAKFGEMIYVEAARKTVNIAAEAKPDVLTAENSDLGHPARTVGMDKPDEVEVELGVAFVSKPMDEGMGHHISFVGMILSVRTPCGMYMLGK